MRKVQGPRFAKYSRYNRRRKKALPFLDRISPVNAEPIFLKNNLGQGFYLRES